MYLVARKIQSNYYIVFLIIFCCIYQSSNSLAQIITQSPILHTYQYESNQKGFEYIYALYCKKNNTIALATDKGIFEFNGTEINPNYHLPHSDFIAFFEENEHVWALPYRGFIQDISNLHLKLDYFNQATYQCLTAYTDKYNTSHFLVSYNGKYYDATKNKQNQLIKKSIAPLKYFGNFISEKLNKPPSNEILNLYFKGKTEFRIKNNRYLLLNETCLDFKNKELVIGIDGKKMGFNESTLVDKVSSKHGGYYLAYMGQKKGLYHFQNNILNAIYSQNNVNAVAIDAFDQVYFTDLTNKLYQIKNTTYTKYHIPLGIKKCFPYANSLYIQTNNGNLNKFSKTKNYLKLVAKNLKHSHLSHEKNTIQFFTENGFYSGENNKLTYKTNPLFTFVSSNSKKFYSTHYQWELLVDKKEIIAKNNSKYTSISSPFNIHTSYQIASNKFELGTANGIYQILFDSNYHLQKTKTNTCLDNIEIKYYAEDSNAIYYCCDKGIVKHDLLKKTYLPILSISPNHPFYDINNIFYYNQFIIGVNQFGFVSYHIPSSKFNQLEFLQHNPNETLKECFVNDSSLYFYSTNNIYQLPTYSILQPAPSPSIYFNPTITNLKITSKNSLSDTFLFFKNNELIIPFNVINIQQNEWNVWHYLLQKENESTIRYIPFEKHQIELNNLDYGKYKITIFFNSQIVGTYSFYLKPKFYQTNWFFITIIAIIILCILFIMHRVLAHKNQRKINKIQHLLYVANLESSSKLNQLKPHFVFNALIPLQNLILKHDVNNSLNFLKQFSLLLRQMLNMSRDNFTPLEQEIFFLEKYLFFKQQESCSFNYQVNTADIQIPLSKIIIPTLLIQPLLENAVEHALPNSINKPGFIVCQFQISSNHLLHVTVSDTGPGFDLLNVIANKKNNALNIIYERIQLLKQNTGIPTISFTQERADNLFSIHLIIPFTLK
jgi:hypothetical protein